MKCRLLILFLTVAAVSVSAQQHRFMINKIFLDYSGPNGGSIGEFGNFGHGFDIAYLYNNGGKVTFGPVFKLGQGTLDTDNKLERWNQYISIGGLGRLYLCGQDSFNRFSPFFQAQAGLMLIDGDETSLYIGPTVGTEVMIGKNNGINLHIGFNATTLEDGSHFNLGIGWIHTLSPREAETARSVPERQLDSDNDGIPDHSDLCPQVAGPEKYMGCPDSDGDGVIDVKDKCPNQYGPEHLKGCPDSDGDGVSDKDDECPNIKGLVSNNGCPATDTDGDGVADRVDECINEKGTMANRGCPDSDNDGVIDKEDECPDHPGPVADAGCPDSDNDGVHDGIDRCPEIAGSRSLMGCPEIEEKDQETLTIAMQAVQFDLGKATLKPESFDILNQIAEIVKKYPGYNLRITGHTDNTGDDELNRKLSEQRARASYEYLHNRGIPESRMSYVGMGESQPIAPNDTEKGRIINRRVEFDLYIVE